MRLADRSPSNVKLSDADLDRMLEFERVERERLYRESAIWKAHRNRLLCICLGQGTALHLIHGSDLNDFDVLRFFARSPSLEPNRVNSSFRAGRHHDFGLAVLALVNAANQQMKKPLIDDAAGLIVGAVVAGVATVLWQVLTHIARDGERRQ
jgi:hypothetical protein